MVRQFDRRVAVLERCAVGIAEQRLLEGDPAAWTDRFRAADPAHESCYAAVRARVARYTPGYAVEGRPDPDAGTCIASFTRQLYPPAMFPTAPPEARVPDLDAAAGLARTFCRHLREYQLRTSRLYPARGPFVRDFARAEGAVLIDLLTGTPTQQPEVRTSGNPREAACH
jgi:hypothetical protein